MNLQRKARFVAGGYTTEATSSITYSSVVCCETIRIGFLLLSIHDVYITAIDMDNAYLNTLCAGKIWFVGGE